jgi:hypothetical protein
MAQPPQARWKNANTLLAVAGLLASAMVFYASRDYPYAPLALGGAPGFYPRVLAVILAILSLVAFVEGLFRPLRVTLPVGANLIRLLALIGLLAVTPLALEWLGFRVMGVLVALGTMLLLSDPRGLNARTLVLFAVVAVIATFALFFIFESVARVPLPRGRLL